MSCKVLNAVEFNPNGTNSENSQSAAQTRSLFTHGPSHKITRRDVSPSDTVYSVDVVATFNGAVAGEGDDVVAIKRGIQESSKCPPPYSHHQTAPPSGRGVLRVHMCTEGPPCTHVYT